MATRRWTCVSLWRSQPVSPPPELLVATLRFWWLASSGAHRLLERRYEVAPSHLPRSGDVIDLGLETMSSWQFVVDCIEWGSDGEITIWLCDLVEDEVFAEIGFTERNRRAHAAQFLGLLRAFGFG